MADRSKGEELVEQGMFAGAAARANPLGDLLYVDPTNGNSGNDGKSELQAVTTLTRAVALASAGDTIICAAGESETVTSSIAVTQAGLKIICLADNPRSGFELNGAGALDLLTVSAANVTIEGLRFDRAAAAGGATAAILTTAAADGLAVRRCVFDCSDSTSAWVNYGIELTGALVGAVIEENTFIDCHRGVLIAVASTDSNVGTVIRKNDFWVGQATAFGIYAEPTGSANCFGLDIDSNLFREVKGSGAAGANFDGTNNADATAGPMSLSARVDQFVSRNNQTDCASKNASFDTLNAIDGTGEYVGNETSTVTDIATTLATQVTATSTDILSVGTAASTDTLSVGTAASTDTLSVGTAASTDTLSIGVLVGAIGTGPFATSVALSTQVIATSVDVLSVGTLVSARATSTALSAQVVATSTDLLSVGVLDGTNATSVGVIASTDTLSVGALVTGQGTTAHATSAALATQVTATSTDVLSVGVAASTDTLSVGTIATSGASSAGLSTQVIATSTDILSVGVVAAAAVTGNTAIGTPLTATKVVAMSTFHDDAQTAAMWTATGDVMIHEIIFEKDATPAAGATNFELTCDNTYGPTGNGGSADLFKSVAATLGANLKLLATAGGVTPMVVPFLLENGAIIYGQGDDAAGSGGNVQVTIYARRVTAGASIT